MKLNFKLFSKGDRHSSHQSKDGTGYSINPVRDWTIGLLVATTCFFIGVTFIGFDFYSQMSETPNQEITTEVKPVAYTEKDVIRYAEFYAEKASIFNKLREQKAYIPPVEEKEIKDEQNTQTSTVPLAQEEEGQYTDQAPSLAQ